jgi:hypothetical protein
MNEDHKPLSKEEYERRLAQLNADRMSEAEAADFIEKARKQSDEYLGLQDPEASAKARAELEEVFENCIGIHCQQSTLKPMAAEKLHS